MSDAHHRARGRIHRRKRHGAQVPGSPATKSQFSIPLQELSHQWSRSCINQDWFKEGTDKRWVSDSLREVFAREYSVLQQDVGSVATRISIRGLADIEPRGCCVAVFDQTSGSLRLTEKLYDNFEHILGRLAAAVGAAVDGTREHVTLVARIREEFSAFTNDMVSPVPIAPEPEGCEQVFTKGSRVCMRQRGQVAEDVEIIQPTLMEGCLFYQVEAPSRPGRPPVKRWIRASDLEPSGGDWEYALWNRRTEEYEDPQDDGES